MPDEGKNKQDKPRPQRPEPPEPGSPEARRQNMMVVLMAAAGLLIGMVLKWLLGRIGR